MKKKIIILDFSTSEVHVFDFDQQKYEDGETFMASEEMEDYDFKESQCQWMIVDELKLEIH